MLVFKTIGKHHMSIDATRWAWQQPVKANQKIVLLSLADRAGENHDCYPSIKRLAQDCGMSRSALFANLEELEKLGLIKRINRSSEKSGTISNIYQLIGVDDRKIMPIKTHQPPVQNLNTPRPESGLPPVQNLDYPPSRIWTTPVQNLDTEPSINHQYINNNNNEKNEVKSVDEVLLSSKDKKQKAKERQKEKSKNVVLFPLVGLDEKQKAEASKKLAQLSQEQRDIAIEMFNNTAQQGRIRKSPMALLNQLVNMGLNNELEAPTDIFNPMPTNTAINDIKTHSEPVISEEEAKAREKAQRIKIAKQYIAKETNKEAMLNDFKRIGAVYIGGHGAFFEPELRAAGLFD